jgi:hypothetical protein
MLSKKSGTPQAFVEQMKTSEINSSQPRSAGHHTSQGSSRLFSAFDEFLDRMPAWIFHTLGGITALIALWFALAFLGGLPGSVVEWITLAMFGTFAYAVGFMIPLIVTYLFEKGGRMLMTLLVVGGSAILGVVTFPLPL